MKLETGDFCPLVNGPCKKFECKWWIQVRGNNPQTGQEIDEWDCTIAFLPMLIVCLLYTSPSPRDLSTSRMPSSA